MRRLSGAPGDAPRPRLPATSKVWAKYPLLSEFMTSTSYDDGQPRQPGYATMRNRTHCLEYTLYDLDSAQRISVIAPDLDSVHAAAEAILGADAAPWVPDDYLQSLLNKKKKK